MKPIKRTKFIGARMTESEKDFVEREAAERRLTPSDYIRMMLLVNMPTVDKLVLDKR